MLTEEEKKARKVAGQRKYQAENREKIAAQRKQYYKENKEKRKQYKEENKEKIYEQQKKWREENKEELAAYNKKYNEENKEKIYAQTMRWRSRNKEKVTGYHKKQLADVLNKKDEIVAHFNNECADCKQPYPRNVYDFHHVNPNEKEYQVARLLALKDTKRLWAELAKCVMLCANCHRIRHMEDED